MKSEKEAPHGGSTPSGAGVGRRGESWWSRLRPPNKTILPHRGSLSVRFATLERGYSTRSLRFVRWRRITSSSNVHRPARPSGEWNDDDFDVLANGDVVRRERAGRNEVARETVSTEDVGHGVGRLLLSSHQKGVRHVEVTHGSYCACNRNATRFGADHGPFGRRPSHRAERAELRCRHSRSARQQERSGREAFRGDDGLGHERPQSCGSPAGLVQGSWATWKQEWPIGKATLWNEVAERAKAVGFRHFGGRTPRGYAETLTSCADQWRGPARPPAGPTRGPCLSGYRGATRMEPRSRESNNLAKATYIHLPCLP